MKKKGDIEVIGLMSGTSLDGLDMALCRFPASMDSFDILAAQTIPHSPGMKKMLAASVELPSEELLELDTRLGKWIGESVNTFIRETGSSPDLIASHGHTVFHQPAKGFTFQIGNAANIYAETGIPVISNFRNLDVALGGEGAPLVPVGDELLFSEYACCLNLGGIANISFKEGGSRKAFDICACNMVLNMLADREGLEFDKNGSLAENGTLIPQLKNQLDGWSFLTVKPPKSLGYEQISSEIFPLLPTTERTDDLLFTFVQHITDEIAKSCGGRSGKLLTTGGGAHNTFLRETLSKKLTDLELVYPDKNLVNYKEALIFAFLGALHHRGRNNVLSSVTGASKDHIGGMRIG